MVLTTTLCAGYIQDTFRGNTPFRGEEGVKIPCVWGVDGVENPSFIGVIYGNCILSIGSVQSLFK
jgi:hypothetical protein